MNIIKFLSKNRHDKSMFNQPRENEVFNAFLSLIIVGSIFTFSLAIYGLVAVVAWVLLTITYYKRGYAPFGTLLVGMITIVITVYQGYLLVEHIDEKRHAYDYVLLSPESGEYADIHTIDVVLQHEDEVFSVYYQFSRSKVYHNEEWLYLDENYITTEGLGRDSYYLIVKVNLIDGSREYYTIGRYYVTGD